jgi:23S rRNA pseudouridine2457 synthase
MILKVGVEIGLTVVSILPKKCEARLIHEIPDFGPRAKKRRTNAWSNRHLLLLTRANFVKLENDCCCWFSYRLVRIRIGNVHLQDFKLEKLVLTRKGSNF